MVIIYARANYATYGRLAQCTGLLAQAASQAAHAVLAAHGEWVTNEKSLLTRDNLRDIDRIIAEAQPERLLDTVEATHALCRNPEVRWRSVPQSRITSWSVTDVGVVSNRLSPWSPRVQAKTSKVIEPI